MERTLQKVNELQSDAKQILERLLGQQLAAEDRVAIIRLPAEPARRSAARDDAWDRLERTLDRMADRAKGASDDEVDAAIEEAMAHARPRNG